jgi:hypothetical protein
VYIVPACSHEVQEGRRSLEGVASKLFACSPLRCSPSTFCSTSILSDVGIVHMMMIDSFNSDNVLLFAGYTWLHISHLADWY